MNIECGAILTSSVFLDEPNFYKSLIFITQNNSSGATGFIINRQHPRKLNELAEFANSKPLPLHSGGPVEEEKLFFIHRRPDLIDEGTLISDSIYLGGNFKQAIMHINNNTLAENDIRLFVGYCGWDAGELEAEVEEGSWIVSNKSIAVFFANELIRWEDFN